MESLHQKLTNSMILKTLKKFFKISQFYCGFLLGAHFGGPVQHPGQRVQDVGWKERHPGHQGPHDGHAPALQAQRAWRGAHHRRHERPCGKNAVPGRQRQRAHHQGAARVPNHG